MPRGSERCRQEPGPCARRARPRCCQPLASSEAASSQSSPPATWVPVPGTYGGAWAGRPQTLGDGKRVMPTRRVVVLSHTVHIACTREAATPVSIAGLDPGVRAGCGGESLSQAAPPVFPKTCPGRAGRGRGAGACGCSLACLQEEGPLSSPSRPPLRRRSGTCCQLPSRGSQSPHLDDPSHPPRGRDPASSRPDLMSL